MRQLYVNVYSVGKAYGGPEEGGWYFNTGTPVTSIKVELTEAEWEAARDLFEFFFGDDPDEWDHDKWSEYLRMVERQRAEKLREELEAIYPRSGKASSVLGGLDYDVVFEDHFARAYPESRPYYE